MRNTSQYGNTAERIIAKAMMEMGFQVSTRRHIGGAGDLVGNHPDKRVWWVEAKKRKHVYEGFRKPERAAMKAIREEMPWVELYVANLISTKPYLTILWIPESEWPQ